MKTPLRTVMAVIAVAAISLFAAPSALANPNDGYANQSDFKVQTLVANINNATSTIDAAGWLDRPLVAGGYLIKVRPTFYVSQDCVSTADPSVHLAVASSFNAFTQEVTISVVQPSLAQKGNHLDWSAHVAFPNPVDPANLVGWYNRCPTGYEPVNIGTTSPQFTVIRAEMTLWPSWYLLTSPPPVRNGYVLSFYAALPFGVTTLP